MDNALESGTAAGLHDEVTDVSLEPPVDFSQQGRQVLRPSSFVHVDACEVAPASGVVRHRDTMAIEGLINMLGWQSRALLPASTGTLASLQLLTGLYSWKNGFEWIVEWNRSRGYGGPSGPFQSF